MPQLYVLAIQKPSRRIRAAIHAKFEVRPDHLKYSRREIQARQWTACAVKTRGAESQRKFVDIVSSDGLALLRIFRFEEGGVGGY